MTNQSRQIRRSQPHTIQAKVLVGYHAWFTCEGDGPPVHQGYHGWAHWIDRPLTEGGRPIFDLFPDVTSYTPAELYTVDGLTLTDGTSARLFSSRNPATVKRHFHWLAEHGIDGVFLQRYAAHLEVDGQTNGPLADLTNFRDEIVDRVKESAEAEGRVWAIEYDVRGVPMDRLPIVIQRDWERLVRQKNILSSPNYLREHGRAVVGIRGLGFKDSFHDPLSLTNLIKQLRSATPGGVYVMAGVSTHWRTPNAGDHDGNPAFKDFYREVDALSPWSVGQFDEEQSADRFATEIVRKDIQEIRGWNEAWAGQKKVDYIPIICPGYSVSNVRSNSVKNEIPRQNGKFLWRQIFHMQREGARILYINSLDGYDDATAILPITTLSRLLPTTHPFLALDADGDTNLTNDWYLRICGMAAEALRGEKRIATDLLPKKELGDYWATRPRYEEDEGDDVAGGSGSAGASYSGTSSSAGVAPQRQATSGSMRSFNLQRTGTMEVEGAPAPPPYSLEAEEQASGGPQPTSSGASNPPAEPQVAAPVVTSPVRQSRPLPTQPPVSQSTTVTEPRVNVPNAAGAPPSSFHPPRLNSEMERQSRPESRPAPTHADSGYFGQGYTTPATMSRPASRPASRPPTSNTQRPASSAGRPASPGTFSAQPSPNPYVAPNYSPNQPQQGQEANPLPGFSGLSMHPGPSASPLPFGPQTFGSQASPGATTTTDSQGQGRPFSPPAPNATGHTISQTPSFDQYAPSALPYLSGGAAQTHPQENRPQPESSPQAPTGSTPPRHQTLAGNEQTGQQPFVGGMYQPPSAPHEGQSYPPTEGGFVLPGQGQPNQQSFQAGVGGFAPNLGRSPSVRPTSQPPPLHPSRTNTMSSTISNAAYSGYGAPSSPPPVPPIPSQYQHGHPPEPTISYPTYTGTGQASNQGTPDQNYSAPTPNQTYPSISPTVPAGQPQHNEGYQPSTSYGTHYTPPSVPPPHTQQTQGYQGYQPPAHQPTYGAPQGPPTLGQTQQYPSYTPGQSYNPNPQQVGSYYGGSHVPSGGYGFNPPPGQPQQPQQPPWANTGVVAQNPALPPRPTNLPLPNTILDPARQYLDKYAGEERRRAIEKGLGSAVNTGTKWLNKFSGSK